MIYILDMGEYNREVKFLKYNILKRIYPFSIYEEENNLRV